MLFEAQQINPTGGFIALARSEQSDPPIYPLITFNGEQTL